MKILKGLVLCGGKSSRMGKDKGSLLYEGRSWAEIAAGKLKNVGLEVFVSVNELQEADYSRWFSPDKLILDNFEGIEGPLKGILSVHKSDPEADWIVFPCDMLLLNEAVLKELIAFYHTCPEYYSFVFETDQEQPFPGIYTSRLLTWVYNYILIEKWNSSRMKDVLKFQPTCKIQHNGGDFFLNLNTNADVEALVKV